MVNRWITALLEAVFPQQCLLCRQPSRLPLPLCGHCRASLPLNRIACDLCALPLPPSSAPGALCEPCLEGQQNYERILAPMIYGPGVRELIGAWKYRRQALLTDLLAGLWLEQQTVLPGCDLLLPVPLHWRRYLWRGFNQAALLARALQRQHPALAAVPLVERGLRRRRHGRSQARLGASARAANLNGNFQLRLDVENLRVAVIDDVVTTGATAQEIARLLRDAGAAEVQIWCLARTPSPGSLLH